MAYKDMLLPIGVALEWDSGAGFQTDVLRMDNGRESRNQNFDAPLTRLVIRYNGLTAAQWAEIDGMFQVAAGRAHCFRVRDPRYNVATTTTGKIVDGQMVFRTTIGSYTIDKVITKPDATVVLDGGGTFSTTTGEILTGTPTAWSGKFWLCMRFDVDVLEVAGINRGADGGYIAVFKDIPLVEALGE